MTYQKPVHNMEYCYIRKDDGISHTACCAGQHGKQKQGSFPSQPACGCHEWSRAVGRCALFSVRAAHLTLWKIGLHPLHLHPDACSSYSRQAQTKVKNRLQWTQTWGQLRSFSSFQPKAKAAGSASNLDKLWYLSQAKPEVCYSGSGKRGFTHRKQSAVSGELQSPWWWTAAAQPALPVSWQSRWPGCLYSVALELTSDCFQALFPFVEKNVILKAES